MYREKEGALLCTAKLTIQLIFLGKWKKIAVREELEAGRKLPRWTNARQYFRRLPKKLLKPQL